MLVDVKALNIAIAKADLAWMLGNAGMANSPPRVIEELIDSFMAAGRGRYEHLTNAVIAELQRQGK